MFGYALIANEKLKTYIWVLDVLVKVMNGKKPIFVVIDNDKVMRKAIKNVLPKATHYICGWHIERNA